MLSRLSFIGKSINIEPDLKILMGKTINLTDIFFFPF